MRIQDSGSGCIIGGKSDQKYMVFDAKYIGEV